MGGGQNGVWRSRQKSEGHRIGIFLRQETVPQNLKNLLGIEVRGETLWRYALLALTSQLENNNIYTLQEDYCGEHEENQDAHHSPGENLCLS